MRQRRKFRKSEGYVFVECVILWVLEGLIDYLKNRRRTSFCERLNGGRDNVSFIKARLCIAVRKIGFVTTASDFSVRRGKMGAGMR